MKALLITFDDATNINGPNGSGLICFRILRNLLYLPKKNSFISSENYRLLFKTHLKIRLLERAFSEKHIWQINNIYDNLCKVVLGLEENNQ